jgi:hypothetical protein
MQAFLKGFDFAVRCKIKDAGRWKRKFLPGFEKNLNKNNHLHKKCERMRPATKVK